MPVSSPTMFRAIASSVPVRRVRAFFFIALALVVVTIPARPADAQTQPTDVQAAPAAPAASSVAGPVIDQGIGSLLAKGQRPDVIVRFRGRADLGSARAMAYGARGRSVYQALKAQAEQSQSAVRQQLERRHRRSPSSRGYTVLWIDNSLLIPEADEAVLDTLRQAADVESIRLDRAIPPPFEPLAEAPPTLRAAGSNIAHVRAPEVWARGYRGEGIVVANIDSGVRYTHQTLFRSYRGFTGTAFDHDYAWYDPYEHTAEPRRNGGHGTHTMGTIVGDDGSGNQIGVAPGARWIACVGSALDGSLYFSGLIECGQFMLAPTDTDGNNPDPDRRPAVVNNSWGGCGSVYEDFYEGVIDAWIAAGIVPVFSNGNNTNCGYPAPPGLNTVGSPGRSGKVLGIGSTGTSDGLYAAHSNQGPTDDFSPGYPTYPDHRGFPDLKPNVSAPGVNIRSAGDASDGGYAGGTGTSMSAPHVTGLVALMWQAAPCLVGDTATTGALIMETANPIAYASGSSSDGPGNVPNQATGWGEIDALTAIDTAIVACGPHGALAGTVVAGDTGQPVAGARLVFHGPRPYALLGDPSGAFARELAAGDYSVDIAAFGYAPTTRAVTVSAGQPTTLAVELAPTPRNTLSGIVTDGTTGWPLHARIHIAQPGGSTQTWSDPQTGAYAIALPAGHDYTLTASPTVSGYWPGSAAVTGLSADMSLPFGLTADTIACTAPGYAGGGGMYEDFEAGALPPGWTRSTDRPGWAGWEFGEDLGSGHFVIPPHGHYAASNDDARPLTSIARRERLITPPLTIEANGQLRYASAYSGGFGLLASIEASTDGGATWTAVASPIATGSVDAPQWRRETVDLSGYAGRTIRLAFRTDDGGGWASGWAIDDVHVSPPCGPPGPGALVLGRVIDSALGSGGLDGATVAVAGGAAPATTASSADAALGAGWYTLHASAGTRMLRVRLPPYADLERSVDVPVSGVVRIDFDFAAPGVADRIFLQGFE